MSEAGAPAAGGAARLDRRTIAGAALRIGLGLLMAWAGAMKLQDVPAFAEEIANFRLLPEFAPLLAAALPTVELAAGFGLLLPRGGWRAGAAWLNLALLAGFTAAVASVRLRGIDVSCGCFGKGSGPVTDLTVLRDLGLVAWAALVLRQAR